MRCPDCGSTLRTVERYDYREPETGYHDCGTRYSCDWCGQIWDDGELDALAETEPPSRFAVLISAWFGPAMYAMSGAVALWLWLTATGRI